MKALAVLLLGLLLAACAPAVYVTPGAIGPAELVRLSDSATNTAAAEARLASAATATDQSARATSTAAAQGTQDALAVRQTESALQLTQSAGQAMATDEAGVKTQAAQQTRAAGTPTAAWVRTQAAVGALEQARNQAQAETVAQFWQTIRFIVAALFVVAGLTAITVVAIDRVSRVRVAAMRETAAIAREAFRLLPPGHWAEYQPGDGYRVYQLPGGLDASATIIENAVPMPSRLHAFRHALRLAGWWAEQHGFGIRDLGPAGIGVLSDPDWRIIFGGGGILRQAGAVADQVTGGEKGRRTGWADNWSYARLSDDLSHGRLDRFFPAEGDPPKVAFTVPNTTPQQGQHNTATQQGAAVPAGALSPDF